MKEAWGNPWHDSQSWDDPIPRNGSDTKVFVPVIVLCIAWALYSTEEQGSAINNKYKVGLIG